MPDLEVDGLADRSHERVLLDDPAAATSGERAVLSPVVGLLDRLLGRS